MQFSRLAGDAMQGFRCPNKVMVTIGLVMIIAMQIIAVPNVSASPALNKDNYAEGKLGQVSKVAGSNLGKVDENILAIPHVAKGADVDAESELSKNNSGADENIAEPDSVLVATLNRWLGKAVKSLGGVLFYPLFKDMELAKQCEKGLPEDKDMCSKAFPGIPFLVLWLIIGCLFFTLRLGFVNLRLFGHAFAVVRGKYTKKDEPGELSHFQALVAAVSATVGLGNIAGVAVAISMGGPGAVLWMVFAGFLGMSAKFAEVTMGQKYRTVTADGRISGGAFHYLHKGLAEKGWPFFGKVLAVVFAIACIGGSLGGGNMFQANQSVAIMKNTFDVFSDVDYALGIILTVSVGIVLFGGIRRIAKVAEAVVPLMAFIYISAGLVVLLVNADKLGYALTVIFQSAFGLEAFSGGMIGAIIAGFKRAAFSSEAGLGSAPIAHATARTTEPVREGCVALLEPFIDTVVICFMTGMLIVITGVYQNSDGIEGVVLTSQAFATVISWFPVVLSIAVVLFAFSTMITWSYYGGRAWEYLFGHKYLGIYYVIFCYCTFVGSVSELKLVMDFSDLLLLSMAIPNLLGLYILSNDLSRDVKEYRRKLKAGEFKRVDEKG